MTATALNLEAAISPEQRAMLQHAAEKQGRSLTDFVVTTVLEVAQRVISQKAPAKPQRPSWTSLLDEIEPHPDFMPDRTPLGDGARLLNALEGGA